MNTYRKMAVGLALFSVCRGATLATDITLDFNGFTDLAGGFISGPGFSHITFSPLGPAPLLITNVSAGGSYSVDFFHNSGAGGSDFSFTINGAGTGVASVGLGGGEHTMVTGFTPGDTTVTLNSHTITYNANGGQKGNYYLYGLIPAHSLGQNSPPQTKVAIPGWVAVDNLYNTGLNNEDYLFTVRSDGTVSAYTNAPHHAEFATFDGANVNPRSILVHYSVQSSTNLSFVGVSYIFPILNFTSHTVTGSDMPIRYEFDMV